MLSYYRSPPPLTTFDSNTYAIAFDLKKKIFFLFYIEGKQVVTKSKLLTFGYSKTETRFCKQ